MNYLFFCEVKNKTRYAFEAEYKSVYWLHNKISRLEAKGHKVEVYTAQRVFESKPIYQNGKFIN